MCVLFKLDTPLGLFVNTTLQVSLRYLTMISLLFIVIAIYTFSLGTCNNLYLVAFILHPTPPLLPPSSAEVLRSATRAPEVIACAA